jgi:tetratricopeptide (TPR) repeat protein
MVLGLIVALALAQEPDTCRVQAEPYIESALERGEMFDLVGAADIYFAGSGQLCVEAELAGHYLRGLLAARAAYKDGGTAASLAPTRLAIAAIDARADRAPAFAAMARAVLLAAAAAAQSERDEMALHLEQALRLEAVQVEAGQKPLPVATAHDVAGDLWLQVHRYDDARRAYERALERIGPGPRILLGLARSSARTADPPAACRYYRQLLDWWDTRRDEPAEIAEARRVVAGADCTPAAVPAR